jgi:putative SOS response-associated peptidase YedK
MCGRFYLISPFIVIASEFDLSDSDGDFTRDSNISPGRDIAAVVAGGREKFTGAANRLVHFHWGLIPFWAKDPAIGRKLFNARAESAAEKPGFRDAFRNRRCLIPTDGFYEWKKTGQQKQPYLIRLKSREPFALAGLFEKWAGPSGDPIYSCAILTTCADETVRPIHDRMPLIVAKDLRPLWLDPKVKRRDELNPILLPSNTAELEALPLERHPMPHPVPEED